MDLSAAAVNVSHLQKYLISALAVLSTVNWNPRNVGLLLTYMLALATTITAMVMYTRCNPRTVGLLFFFRFFRLLFNTSPTSLSTRRSNNASFSSNTVQVLVFALIISQASAVSMAGLPLWPSTEGPSYFPVFLNAIGAFLTIQLGCSFFQVIKPSDIPVTYEAGLDNCADEPAFKKLMTTARAIVTIALTPNKNMTNLASKKETFRDAIMCLYEHCVGDCESEVLRNIQRMMQILLSRGHTNESAKTSLTMISELTYDIRKLDVAMVFSEHQMMGLLSLFARNSECSSLVLHEQILRQIKADANGMDLEAVMKHYLDSFPTGTVVMTESDGVTELSADGLIRACAMTNNANPRSRQQNHRSEGASRTNTHQCFKCGNLLTSLPKGHTSYKSDDKCTVIAHCSKCDMNPGSHSTAMCEPYHNYSKLRRERAERGGRRAESALPTARTAAFIPYDDENDDTSESLFFRSACSVQSVCDLEDIEIDSHMVPFLPDDDNSLSMIFSSSYPSQPILKQRSLTATERGTSQQHGNSTHQSPFAHLNDDTHFTFVRRPYGLRMAPQLWLHDLGASTVLLQAIQEDVFEPQVEIPISYATVPATSESIMTQRSLTALERGTSIQHGNSTLQSPFAHPPTLGLDTMCWNHFVGDMKLLINIRELSRDELQQNATKVASGSQICPSHRGDLPVILRTTTDDTLYIIFENVLYAANFDNLLSIGQLRNASRKAQQPTFDWREEEGILRFRFPGMSDWVDVAHTLITNCYYLRPLSCGPKCLSITRVAAAVLPRSHVVTSAKAQQRLAFINPVSLAKTIACTIGVTLSDNPLKLTTQEAALHGTKTAAPIIKRTSADANGEHVRRNWTDMRFETLHIDLHGPYPPGLINKCTHFMSYTTDAGVTWVSFLKSSKAIDIILQTKEAFTRLGTPRNLRSDNSMTLFAHDPATQTAFEKFLIQHDVALKISAPNCQWQNGVAERTGGRTVYEKATSMLFDAGLSTQWWTFAVGHYAEISNCVATKRLYWKTPIEVHFGYKPTIAHLRRFGCPAFLHLSKKLRESPAAFNSRVHRAIHLGNAPDAKLGVYLLYDLQTKRLCKSQSLFFDEDFDIVKKGLNGWEFQLSLLNSQYSSVLFRQTAVILPPGTSDFRVSQTGLSPYLLFVSDEADDHDITVNTPIPVEQQQPPLVDPPPQQSPLVDPPSRAQTPSSNSSDLLTDNILSGPRNRHPVTRLNVNPQRGGDAQWQDNIVSAAHQTGNSASAMETLAALVLDDHVEFRTASMALLDDHVEFRTASMAAPPPLSTSLQYLRRRLTSQPDNVPVISTSSSTRLPPLHEMPPVDYSKVTRQVQRFVEKHGEAGRTAFDDEMTGMINAKVFSLPVDLPPGHLAFPGTMLSTEKPDGRLKMRLVFRGDLQVEGVNYIASELYAPVMDKTSFRLLLAIGAAHNAHIHTLDVNLAFLYGTMDDELYMRPPQGISLPFGKVWRVLKSLYGTKQAPAIWHAVLKDWLLQQGLTPTQSDPCVFVKRDGDKFFFVGVHVDDLLMVTTSTIMLADFKRKTEQRFSFKDQGELNEREFTGCYVQYNRLDGCVKLSCDRSIKKLLELTDFVDSNPHVTPMSKQAKRDTTADESELVPLFGSISGHANWMASLCRPDVAFASSMLASYNWKNPTISDVKDAKRLLRFFRGNLSSKPRTGLTYSAQSFADPKQALIPVSFADSDHAGDPAGGPITKRSRSGQCIWFCGGLIYWKSALQNTVATSTTYAEVIALSDLCKQLVWLLALLTELGFPQKSVPVYEDNQPAIDSILADHNSKRIRHYQIRYFWIRELVDKCKIITLLKVNTELNYADFWTKILPKIEMVAAIKSFMNAPLSTKFHPSSA